MASMGGRREEPSSDPQQISGHFRFTASQQDNETANYNGFYLSAYDTYIEQFTASPHVAPFIEESIVLLFVLEMQCLITALSACR